MLDHHLEVADLDQQDVAYLLMPFRSQFLDSFLQHTAHLLCSQITLTGVA